MRKKTQFFITGDTHGQFERVSDFITRFNPKPEDVLIILGDAGINFYGGEADKPLKDYLATFPLTLFSIHGNHEQRPESLEIYDEVPWRGGSAYIEADYPNLIFGKDGEVYNFGGLKTMPIGGAYSIDKEIRLSHAQAPDGFCSWWPDEQPSEAIKERVEKRLEAENWQIDVVLTHTAPLKYRASLLMPRYAMPKLNQRDLSTEKWLDSIENRLTYKKWYCGHFHINRKIYLLQCLYYDILEFLA